ncbi:NAD(P)H-binding protein [Actinoplanes hulinensis]|uniref:NAD(P)H-binding protein n=1 Tax=Actinoplanes hulinensis TaxID=1144547 RepID=A0ABS7BAH7_9ACTN|nr:NAD(P)H-binding protein [Actinoplanes hulinensis]MBW6438070.1 NAD(P)H-binding protein [Actinoplanes hulinensis]
MTVLVTGASGTLGTAVVPALTAAGHRMRPMSRRARPGWVTADLASGDGLDDAVRGADAIVHLASAPGRRQRETDVEGTRRLLAAAAGAGVRHALYVSIVGIDRVPLGYYRTKLATEVVVRDSGVPFTILRATQFPSLVDTLFTTSSRLGPLIVDPGLRVQPVHVQDVAERIVALLGEPATGQAAELAGPQVLTFGEMARPWLAARGSKRPVWSVRLPGGLARAVREGGLVGTTGSTGTRTWDDYLDERYGNAGCEPV